jgi:hypothetical protein
VLVTGGGWSPAPEHGPAPTGRRRPLLPALVALVATALLISVSVVFLVFGTDDDPTAEEAAGTLDVAADRLVDEGSFAFEGSIRIEGSPSPSGSVTAVESTSTGRADQARIYTETTEQSDGTASELVLDIDGGLAWWRVTAFADRLADRSWVRGDVGDREVPAPLRDVRNWLEDATDARDGGRREGGRAVVANLPTLVLNDVYGYEGGDERRFMSARLTATIDDAGLPVRIEVVAAASDFALELDYRLDDFGVPVDVVLPSGTDVDPTPTFREEDIAELDGRARVGLSRVPAGWALVAAHVRPDENPDCTGIQLAYGSPVDPAGSYLIVWITSPDCVNPPPGARPFTAGSRTGVLVEEPDGVTGVFLDGSGVAFHAVGLSAGDLSLVLASLGPLDLTAAPAPIEGIPSTPA